MVSIDERLKNIMMIRDHLVRNFGTKIKSAIVYGSTLNADFCSISDYDILLIFDTMSIDTLKKIHDIKAFFKDEMNITIDFNSHLTSDLPSVRGNLYWHNNRSEFIQQELAMTGYPVIGSNPFADYRVDEKAMQIEAVKMVNSFAYQTRKMFINKELNRENRLFVVKWCIYGSLYLLAGKGLFYRSREQGLAQFSKEIQTDIDPMFFLDIKRNRPAAITDVDLEKAYEYINFLDTYAMDHYMHLSNNLEKQLSA